MLKGGRAKTTRVTEMQKNLVINSNTLQMDEHAI